MSVVIKTGVLKYKNENDEYEDFNMIAQESTDQQIASIETAGQAVLDSIPEDYTELSNDVTELKSAFETLPDVYVAIAGENQVTPQNIAGVEFTKTETTVYGDNIFSESYIGETGYYAAINPNVTPPIISHGGLSGYRWYAIPVDGESVYKFTEARFACLGKGNAIGSEAVGTLLTYATEINTTGASYLFLSYAPSVTTIEVRRGEIGYVYSDFIMPVWMRKGLEDAKPKYATITGNLSDGDSLSLTGPRTNLRKGERIVFEGNITSFDSIDLCLLVAASANYNIFRIDGTNVSYYARLESTPIIVPHGLTISENIQAIWELSAVGTLKLTVISDGSMFAHDFAFTRQSIGSPCIVSNGSILTACKLTWTCSDIDKKIWMFGDSYFSYASTRWTYYLHQYGYDQNCLLDGFPGEGGINGRVAFGNLLAYGTPQKAVWCLGMNDTSDSSSAPATNWVNARDVFLLYCNQNGVEPIFGTIPTVPSINHEQKNAWIRSSGYRYIDFAKAVGATANGTWFSGMLSTDNIHPTEKGARALFAQVLLDLPEIMIGGYGTPTSAT